MCARRADGERVHDKELIKPPCPLRVQRFSSMKRTPRVVIPPHTQKCRKNAKWELLSPPPTGLPPKPSKAVSVGRGRATERASPAACGGTRDSSSARTTASIAFVWSAAKPLPCQMHWAGRGPTPHFRAEAHTHLKLRAFLRKRFYPPPAAQLQRGDQSPFEEFPALRGGKRNNSRKVIHYEKRYQIQHAHGVR